MTWTYDPTKLGERNGENLTDAAKLAGVRFLVGDTDAEDHLVEDEEIQYVISTWYAKEGTLEWVASVVADTIANRYAREVSYSADGVSIGLGPVAEQFRALAAALRQQHRNLLVGGGPDVGGVTPGEETDPRLAPFSFGTQMHDNVEAGPQDFGGRGYKYYSPEEHPGA